jgi:predicted XRE-type DNA-binding protein
MKKNKNIGSSFDDFLESEGIYHEVEALAIKKYFAALIEKKMQDESISKTRMAALMQTSRSAVNRLLDPTNDSITLHTMENAARAIGKKLKLELI